MIVDALLSWIAGAIHWLLSLLPAVPALDKGSWAGPIATVWTYAGWANDYIPLDSAAIILGLTIAAFWLFYGAYFALWILDKLHITGGN